MTTEIVTFQSVMSMTSREIAELTSKRHDNVLRDIKAMLSQVYDLKDNSDLSYQEIQGVTVEIDQQTKRVSCISLDKDHTLTLLTGYDAKARMRVIKRWQELERAQAVPVLPADYLSALKALVASEERKQALEQDNALLNTIIDNEFGYCSILRAAQHLGVHESVFNWRPLKKETLLSGLEIKRVPSPRYEYQNLYPIKVFERCYPQYDFSGLQPEAVATRATKLLTGNVSSHSMVAH